MSSLDNRSFQAVGFTLDQQHSLWIVAYEIRMDVATHVAVISGLVDFPKPKVVQLALKAGKFVVAEVGRQYVPFHRIAVIDTEALTVVTPGNGLRVFFE